MLVDRFRQVALFAELADEDLGRICTEAEEVRLEPGEVLFREGDHADRAFIVVSGKLEILKSTDRREVMIALRGEDEVIGEMALLEEEPRAATVRARTPVELVAIPKSALDDLLATSAKAARAVFQPLIRRVRETNDQLRHQERMAQLGVMTAGVAHELNNPSAAVQRAAEQLSEEVLELVSLVGRGALGSAYELLVTVAARPLPRLTAVQASDEEAALEDWLDDRDVPDAWQLAPALVSAGITVGDLEGLESGEELADAVRFLASAASVRRSAAQMAEGSRRLSEIVGALRSYTFLDRAPLQEVDVVAGLEDTLVVLAHATTGIAIVREYADALPTITALGAELNQVWTNLVHNACDALAGTPDPTITLRAFVEGNAVVVEVEDNGPGIPEEIQSKVFDAFFTTKPPGHGTGLGLQISYRIAVLEHDGELTVSSEPGRTTFRVSLPLQPPSTHPTDERTEHVSREPCEHLAAVENTPKPEGGCEQCLALGDTWVHLRFCAECGQVGCCNDSKNKHASRHATDAGHPVMRTKEPGENWAWCFVDEMGIHLD